MEKRSPIGFVFLAVGCVLIVSAVATTRIEASGPWLPCFIGLLGMLSLGGFAEQLSDHPVSKGWWAFVAAGTLLLAFSATWLYVYKAPDTYGIAAGATGALLFSAGLGLQLPQIVAGTGSRTLGSQLFSAMLTVLALAIAIAAVQVAKGPLEHQFDLTRDRKFTTSDQTIQILAAIKDDIAVHAFFNPESAEKTKFDDLIAGFKNHTSHLVVENVNPLDDPLKAYQFAVTNDNTVVLELGDRKQRIESNFTEENVANAIVKLQSAADHAICWAVGRGEADPDDDQTPQGMGAIVQKLEGANYQVTKKVNVLIDGIPSTCEAIVIAHPEDDWGPAELTSLAQYIAGGGRALILLEAIDKATGKVSSPNLANDLARYGIVVDNDFVVETDPRNVLPPDMDPTQILMRDENYAPGAPITRNLHAYTAFTFARSMHAKADAKGVTTQEVIKTSASAWGEVLTEGGITGPAKREPGVDKDGPLPILVTAVVDDPSQIIAAAAPVEAPAPEPADTDAATGPVGSDPAHPFGDAPKLTKAPVPAQKAGGRLVVIGDSDFVSPSDVGIAFGSNQDVFLNSVAWLVDEQSQLGERPKPADTLELSGVAVALIAATTLFLVPGACLALAVIVLVRRRFL
jgi:hypothetical protein